MENHRKKEGRTNYKKRISLLASNKPRLVIRKSLRHILAQIIMYNPDGDKTIISAHSRELIQSGYKAPKRNLPTAYLVGVLIAKKAREKSIQEVIPDIGFYPGIKGSLPFAVIKGVKDGGIEIPFDNNIIPEEKRIEGKHIEQYAAQAKDRFLHYGMDPLEISKVFHETKRKLINK